MATTIKVYGAGWCHDTRDTKKQLDALGLPYEYHDIDKDPAAAKWVLDHNGGKRKLPTVDIDGRILSVPDEEELNSALENTGP